MVVIVGSPLLLEGELGAWLTAGVASMLVIGGTVGAIACWRGVWWLERVTLMLCGLGWGLLYPSMIYGDLHPLVRLLILTMLALAIFDVVKRYRRIDWAYLDPSK
jgi:hypothetical protein